MKRTLALVAVLSVAVLANVRAYTDVADPTINDEVRHGVVLVSPAGCYGVEIYGYPAQPVQGIEPFGGPCE